MGVLDFLTEGKPIAAQPYASTTETVLPDWYTNYAMDILANQQAVAGRPMPIYQGPRVAEMTADQMAGFQTTREAAQMSGANAAQPYFQQASQTVPQAIPQYMNPYQDAVIGRIGEQGLRTLKNTILPGIEGEMIRAGQFGGTRQAELMGRAIRNTMDDIGARQAEFLERGYTGAQSAAQADLSRMANLGQTVGGLTQAQQQIQARMGEALAGAGALQQGQTQRNLDLAYQDFLRQQGYPQEQIDAMIKTLGGVAPAIPQARLQQGYGPQGGQQERDLSPLQQIGGTVSGIAALAKELKGLGIF